MPTSSSSAVVRSRCAPLGAPASVRPSAICAPTVRRGLSEANGFWKTIWMRASSRLARLAARAAQRPVRRAAPRPPSRGDEPDGRLARASTCRSPTRRRARRSARARPRCSRPRRRAPGRGRGRGRRPRGRESRAALIAAPNGSTWQASRRVAETATSGGTSTRHCSAAYGHRGWNAQPAGRARGRRRRAGDRDELACRRPAPGCGSASSSARVYGWRGVVEQLARRAGLDDAARVEDRDLVGDRRHHAEVVGDQDHREARSRGAAGRAGAGCRPGR